MSHWVGDRDAGWLSLATAHNDAVRLAADLMNGLRRSYPSFDASVAQLVPNGGAGSETRSLTPW